MNPYLSVTAPVERAINRVKQVLFQPFDLGRWFVIGFCAWLAYFGESGGGGGGFGGPNGGGDTREVMRSTERYVIENLYWILPLAIGISVVLFAIWVLILWLSSRGKFMFLHCVAQNVARVREPWEKYQVEADSLFWFRVVFTLILLVPTLPLGALLVVLIWHMMAVGHIIGPGLLMSMGILFILILLAIVVWAIGRLLNDFVVPLQYLRRQRCREAWKELLTILRPRLGGFALYLLFRVVLGMATGVLVLLLVFATCCLAGCLLAIPYIGTVLLLPILVFERSYSLYFFAQLGPDYDVFVTPSPAMT